MNGFNAGTGDSGAGPENTTVLDVEGQPLADTSGANGDQGGDNGDEPKEPRVFSQEELDKIVEKRIARERTKFTREQEVKAQEEKLRTAPIVGLHLDDFDSPEDYAEALAQKRVELLTNGRQAIQKQQESQAGYYEKEAATREKYADFDTVALNLDLKVTEFMGEAILASDVGPEVLYHLGKNPAEAERISNLTPARQALEIGRLEGKLAGQAKQERKTSEAPAPISPVGGRAATGGKAFDPNDPSFMKTMSTSEWIEADRAYQRKRLGGG